MPYSPSRSAQAGRWRSLYRAGALAGALVVGTSVTPAVAPAASAAVAVQPVGYWQLRFDRVAAGDAATNLPLSRSSDSWDFYDLAYSIDANVSMFEATGATGYLDQAISYASNMVATARPSSTLGAGAYGDGYLGWVSQRSDVAGSEVPLFESYAWRYVARLLRVIHDSPAVYPVPGYRAAYQRLLRFTEVNMFDKWMARGATSNVYRVNTHMASHWAYIAMELERLTTDPARRSRARTVVDNIDLHLPNYPGASLKAQMRWGTAAPGAYFWSDRWGASTRPGQDVAHGNAVISYVTEARDLGTTWTATDITALGHTLTDLVMPHHATYVDGTGAGTGWLADGFVKLGRYSLAVQQALETYPVQGQAQYLATMAVNARRLTDPASAPVPTGSTPTSGTAAALPTAAGAASGRTVPRGSRRRLVVSVTPHRTRAAVTVRGNALTTGRTIRLQRRHAGAWQTVAVRRVGSRHVTTFAPRLSRHGLTVRVWADRTTRLARQVSAVRRVQRVG